MATNNPTVAGSTASADEGSGPTADADNPPEPAAARSERRAVRPPAGEPEVTVLAAPGLEQCVDLDWLQRRLAAALAETGRPWRRVSVMVAGDERMRGLNRAHRDRDATTDVLAFESSAAGEPLEADVVVGADEAARQAAARQHRIEQELLLYALHGVLHCAGWDDQTPQGFEAMHTEEDRILGTIGVGPTFGARRSGRTGRPEGSVRRSHSVG